MIDQTNWAIDLETMKKGGAIIETNLAIIKNRVATKLQNVCHNPQKKDPHGCRRAGHGGTPTWLIACTWTGPRMDTVWRHLTRYSTAAGQCAPPRVATSSPYQTRSRSACLPIDIEFVDERGGGGRWREEEEGRSTSELLCWMWEDGRSQLLSWER